MVETLLTGNRTKFCEPLRSRNALRWRIVLPLYPSRFWRIKYYRAVKKRKRTRVEKGNGMVVGWKRPASLLCLRCKIKQLTSLWLGIVGNPHIYIYRRWSLPNRQYINAAIRKTIPEKLAKINSTLTGRSTRVSKKINTLREML